MRLMVLSLSIVFLLFCVMPDAYAAPSAYVTHSITVDLAEDYVDISAGFDGAHISLFGMREGKGDIAIVIRGPVRDMVVRRKGQLAGAWINRSSKKFKDVPLYYDYALSDMALDMKMPEALKKVGVGLSGLSYQLHDAHSTGKLRAEFKDALIRNKQAKALFPKKPQGVKFLNDKFFRADFYIPANVPVGEYRIQTYYFLKGKIRNVKTNILKVEQVGASAGIKSFSKEHSFIYGLLCVCVAVFAGWVSNRVRRA